jgi:hypothetical protein
LLIHIREKVLSTVVDKGRGILILGLTEGYAGVFCRLAAIVSTTAMRHQLCVQHEYLSLGFCQSQDANNVE